MPPPNDVSKGLGLAMRLGIQMVTPTLVGAGVGYLLDFYLGTKPWIMVVGLFLGGAAGFRDVYRLVKKDLGRSDSGKPPSSF